MTLPLIALIVTLALLALALLALVWVTDDERMDSVSRTNNERL